MRVALEVSQKMINDLNETVKTSEKEISLLKEAQKAVKPDNKANEKALKNLEERH